VRATEELGIAPEEHIVNVVDGLRTVREVLGQ